MKKAILAIDQGTTGTKALLMSPDLDVLGEGYADFPQHFPKPGWVEHDLDEIWASVEKAVKLALTKAGNPSIEAIGITNQRETVCFWEKGTTKPLAHAIVWQDRRTDVDCRNLKKKGLEKMFQKKTGLLLDPYFSGTKIAWALKHWGDLKSAERTGKLSVGTIESFLIARLSGGSAHLTESSNASRTLLFGLKNLNWDDELLRVFRIKREILPQVLDSAGIFAETKGLGFLPNGIPITGCLGDQQSALLGQGAIEEGSAKCTFGTGSFLLFNTGSKIVRSKNRLLTTVAWKWKGEGAKYALEGSAFISGAAIQWFRDALGMIGKSSEIGDLASSVSSSEGALFLPALSGLGAPHWVPGARGMFLGLTRGTTKAHLARALLEGISFQNVEILKAMESDTGKKLKSLSVDGGAAASDTLMQIQSDLLGVKLQRPRLLSVTALGAVFSSGLGAGVYRDLKEIRKVWKLDREFSPTLNAENRAIAAKKWRKAISFAKEFSQLNK